MKPIDISQFQNRINLRPLRSEDYDQLISLEKKCFPGIDNWKYEHIQSQIQLFPEGQLVIEYNNRIIASCSSIIVNFDDYSDTHSWMEIADSGYIRNHDPEGDALYDLEIMVDPEFRGMKLARRLYDARKQLCVNLNLRRMIVGGRIPGYREHKNKMTVREYVDRVAKNIEFDPVLSVQLANGFFLKKIIQAYDIDQASDNSATLLEWVNLDYRPKKIHKKYQLARQVRLCVVQYQMRPINHWDEFKTQCEYFVDVASNSQTDLVLFPEILTTQLLSLCPKSTPSDAIAFLSDKTEDYIKMFSSFSMKYNVNIVAGSHYSMEENKVYNMAYLFKRNGEIHKQYKLHVTPSERRWWRVQPGNSLEVFDTDCGKIAILIGYDSEFPELARIAVEKGARLLLVPFCTEDRQSYLRIRYCCQARSIENQVYTALSGTVGNLPFVPNMDVHYGQSALLTPSDFSFARDGIAAECTPNLEMLAIQDVDLAALERHRLSSTVQDWNDRRTDLYKVLYLKETPN